MNPYSAEETLQDLGSTKTKENRKKLVTGGKEIGMLKWTECVKAMRNGEGKIITPEDIEFEEQFILDIDLDAFSCYKNRLYSARSRYDELNFKQRIDLTIEALAKLRKPDIITITRSQGHDIYVPPHKVDAVQEYLLEELEELYVK
jgi:hypothetical protein